MGNQFADGREVSPVQSLGCLSGWKMRVDFKCPGSLLFTSNSCRWKLGGPILKADCIHIEIVIKTFVGTGSR